MSSEPNRAVIVRVYFYLCLAELPVSEPHVGGDAVKPRSAARPQTSWTQVRTQRDVRGLKPQSSQKSRVKGISLKTAFLCNLGESPSLDEPAPGDMRSEAAAPRGDADCGACAVRVRGPGVTWCGTRLVEEGVARLNRNHCEERTRFYKTSTHDRFCDLKVVEHQPHSYHTDAARNRFVHNIGVGCCLPVAGI